MFIADDVQLNDVAFFCVDKNGVFSIGTMFSLYSNWVADTCYENTQLKTQNRKHPYFWSQFLFILKKMLSSLIGLQAKYAASSQR